MFIDINMPGINGFETVSRILGICKERGVGPPYFVGLTGDNTETIRKQARENNMEQVLVKPIIRDDLRKFLSTFFNT
jgi:CheY-like chemotaxis protein